MGLSKALLRFIYYRVGARSSWDSNTLFPPREASGRFRHLDSDLGLRGQVEATPCCMLYYMYIHTQFACTCTFFFHINSFTEKIGGGGERSMELTTGAQARGLSL